MAVEEKKHTLSDGTTVFAARNMHKQDIRRSNGNLRYEPQFEQNERRQKKKYHQNNVIQTQMQAEFNITIFLCSVMTTDALYNAI